jgi:hypothetical protein
VVDVGVPYGSEAAPSLAIGAADVSQGNGHTSIPESLELASTSLNSGKEGLKLDVNYCG